MNLAFGHVKVYFKLTVMVAVALLAIIMVWFNRHHTVDVWFFGTFEGVNVLWLMLCVAAATLVCWQVFRLTRSVMRDMRNLHAAQQEKENRQRQHELLQKLSATEKNQNETDTDTSESEQNDDHA